MSRFTRAYEAALRSAQLSKADAAAAAGLHPSTVSRILGEEIAANPEHVDAMLRALPDTSDRRHCLREFLFDQAPREEWDALVIHFGALHDPRPSGRDDLGEALDRLEVAATDDKALRKLLIDWANYVGPPGGAVFSALDEKAKRKVAAENGRAKAQNRT